MTFPTAGKQLRWLRVVAVIVCLLGIVAIYRWVDPSFYSTERITGQLDRAGAFAPLLFVAIMAGVVIISPLPSLPFDIAGGAYFGWFPAGVLALLGATMGAAVCFLIARWIGRDAIERWVGGHVIFCGQCSDQMLTGAVIGARLLPVLSFDLVSYGAGLTAMSLGRFVVATALGAAPLTFLYTWAGPQVWTHLVDFGWLAIPVVIAFLVVPRWLEKRASGPAHDM